MTELHRNDAGAYTVTKFDALGRKVGHDTRNTYTEAVELCDDWVTEDSRNSAVVHRCVYNSLTPTRHQSMRI